MSKEENPRTTPQLTRIPVKHMWFHDSYDVPGAGNQLSNLGPSHGLLTAAPASSKEQRQPKHYLCFYVPAWQQMELHSFAGGDAPAEVNMIPMTHIKRWQLA